MWLLALIPVAIVGAAIAFGGRRDDTRVAGTIIGARLPSSVPKHSPMAVLAQATRVGAPIPPALVAAALQEASQRGDRQAFAEILRVYPPPIASQKQSKRAPVEESAPQTQPDIVVGKNSPIKGVDNEQWSDFIAKLKTHEAAYRDERNIGAFHHNLKRLSELGIDPATLTTEDAQYGALETDFKSTLEACRKMINDWSGDVIQLDGKATPVTRSGLLALIKAAGPEGAKQWLTSEQSRTSYPNTTSQFLRCNGLF